MTSVIKSMFKDITNEYFSSLGSMSIVSSDSSVYQCGHIIIVNLILSASSFNSAQNATVAEAYRPKKNINSYAGFVASQWNQVVHVGYNYIGTNGEFILTDNGSGDKFARVKLTYCI